MALNAIAIVRGKLEGLSSSSVCQVIKLSTVGYLTEYYGLQSIQYRGVVYLIYQQSVHNISNDMSAMIELYTTL